MSNIIEHVGIVEKMDANRIVVKIVQASACSGCSAKNLCSSSESKEKLIDVVNTTGKSYEIGQTVMVQGTTLMGFQAILFAFILPFFVMVTTLFVGMQWTNQSEAISALLSLAALIPYYILLYFFKNNLKKKFLFRLKQ
ncbi:MAG: SoxR reducing system RseC family protein [Bacteroidaceae bacterium]